MDFHGFSMDLRGSGTRMFSSLWRPLAADWIPYKKHFRRIGGLDLKAWCLDAWMLAGLKGLEEVADRWEEGIGRTEDLRTSHTLDALGGRRISTRFLLSWSNWVERLDLQSCASVQCNPF